jgi:flagellar motor switch protein FliN/FliY
MSDNPNAVIMNAGTSAFEEMQFLGDVPIKISIQLGTQAMKVRDILQLQASSLIELEKSAGENVDILMNGTFVASGEVIKLEGSTGIRLTDFNTGK